MPLIVFASAAGGVGCSTAAGHCAHLWQQAGHASLAVDGCMNNGLSLTLGLAEIPPDGWSTQPPLSTEYSDWSCAALQAPSGLQLLPYGAAFTPTPALLPAALWPQLSAASTLSVVDVGPHLLAYAPHLLPHTDVLVLCTSAHSYARPQMQHLLQGIQASGAAPRCMRLLAGRYDARRNSQKESLTQLLQAWPALFLTETVHEDEHVALSVRQGIPVHERYPHAQAAHDLHGVSHRILQLLGRPCDHRTLP